MLKDKVAVVTGGTRGTGFAVVKKFLENGANVALFGSRQSTVDKALEELHQDGWKDNVTGMAPDHSSKEEISQALHTVLEKWGRLDILVNNAGISARDSIYEYDYEDLA